jgi:uncharacterized protein YndB with AHSA1/START domain
MASKLLVALRVPAKPQRAFEAFVYEIAEWWRPNGLFDFTVGRRGRIAFEPGAEGRLTETYEDGSVFEVGRITAWEPPALLAFTSSHNDTPPATASRSTSSRPATPSGGGCCSCRCVPPFDRTPRRRTTDDQLQPLTTDD